MRTQKRRRRECRTDYLKRIKLLKGGTPRLVFRRTNRYLIIQYIKSKEAQDRIILSVNSKDLLKYGWPKESAGSLKSIPASYLISFLTGKRILKEKLEKPIIDFGMFRVIHKTRMFAFLKGIIDAGIKIECEEKFFPGEDRIKGIHLKNKIKFDEILKKISESDFAIKKIKTKQKNAK